jgi:AraC family transcriptional regulator of adaptative response / DNA-3-methyladenine glycosylase II
MIRFLDVRAIKGVEEVSGGRYSRVIELGGVVGTIQVEHAVEASALRVVVRFSRLEALPTIIARIRRMFDLSAEPGAIAAALASDPPLAPLVAARPGLRVPGGWDAFEIAVRAVLGQQITVRGGTQLAARIVAALGEKVESAAEGSALTHAFPRAEEFSISSLTGLGMTRARATAIAGIAAAAVRDPHLFDPRSDLPETVGRLRELPGVGEWTAQYIAMRGMGESDAFLAGDVAVQKRFDLDGHRPTPAELLARAERWRPWRAYATLHLWMADDDTTLLLGKEKHHALTA